MGAAKENRPSGWMRKVIRKRGVVVVGVCVVAGSIAVVDEYAGRVVKDRVEAEYFAGLRDHLIEEVEAKLRKGGCNVQAGVTVAHNFLKKERDHITVAVTRQPKRGWEVQRYRFTIRWRSTWLAKFRINEKRKPQVLERNSAFEDEVESAVCNPACGWLKCWFVRKFGNYTLDDPSPVSTS